MNIVRHQPSTLAAPQPATETWDPFRMMRDLMRWDPFREIGFAPGRAASAVFMPDIDVKETASAYVFRADVPGIKEKDLEVSLTGNRLTLSGKREEEKREDKEMYHAVERSSGSFTRSFTLPQGSDAEHAKADLKDGVLTISVPKLPEVQPKKIAVGTGAEKKAQS